MEVFIIRRSGRTVVSCAFNTPHLKRGYTCCVNWRDLEAQAQRIIEQDKQGGPQVWECPAWLAQRAQWSNRVEQAVLFDEAFQTLPENEAHP